MKIKWSHKTMVSWRMVFGGVISKISGTRSPVDKKFLVVDAILNPVEVHVHGFSPFDFDC